MCHSLATPQREVTPESAAERLRCAFVADQATMEKPETGPSIVHELAYSQKGGSLIKKTLLKWKISHRYETYLRPVLLALTMKTPYSTLALIISRTVGDRIGDCQRKTIGATKLGRVRSPASRLDVSQFAGRRFCF
jgi:hypothetical protein